MNHSDIARLLAIVAGHNQRTVGDADVLTWHDAATLARWTYPEAERAIRQHYATSTERWIMPGHVTELIRAERRQPARHQRRALRGGPLPASDATRTAAMAEIRRVLAKEDV